MIGGRSRGMLPAECSWRIGSVPDHVAEAANEIREVRDVHVAARDDSRRLKQSDDLRCRRSSRDTVHLDVTDTAVTVDDEDGWRRDAPALAGVIDVPLLHDPAVSIGENGEREAEVSPERL